MITSDTISPHHPSQSLQTDPLKNFYLTNPKNEKDKIGRVIEELYKDDSRNKEI
jgi:hypothetical protein